MPTLRLTQSAISANRYRVELELDGVSGQCRAATAEFEFALAPQDGENLRWYLEEYLQCRMKPNDPRYPEQVIAEQVENRVAQVGSELFDLVFGANKDTRELWSDAARSLGTMRVEVLTDAASETVIPWEIIQDSGSGVHLALETRAFVRATPSSAVRTRLHRGDCGPVRILLVICRPAGRDDVPFRSVAARLLLGLGKAARQTFQLDVLRPATFAELGHSLSRASAAGKPYDVVHFDGHGVYMDSSEPQDLGWLNEHGELEFTRSREGPQGYLAFEPSSETQKIHLVDGVSVGRLLAETNTAVLVLNACRSAHYEALAQPSQTGEGMQDQVRAYGSLAWDVMNSGAAGVVAMRYSVYVVTAAQFVAELYTALAQGKTLGEAVAIGRRHLRDRPERQIAYEVRPLQDWLVPVVFEAAPVELFPVPPEVGDLDTKLDEKVSLLGRGKLDPCLPARPDMGFFGRDETLLALDRAFDRCPVVLLHAYAGIGKTVTAAEFARWYALTGGVEGPVVFTSFEHHKTLPRVLDELERVVGESLEAQGIHWLALNEKQRREVALQVLRQMPVLWIWDNVEPIAGFPAGTPSAWSSDEQRELAEFLRSVCDTKAKFLLTSRRDERAWLGELPRRVPVPPMPMQERVQLARAIAERHERRITDVDDWRPVLHFADGNPMTIIVVVGQALRDGLHSSEQIDRFVEKLRVGEAEFDNEDSPARSKSLASSLRYGFEQAFQDAERRKLAVLHLFQGFIDVDVLCAMGNPTADCCVGELRGLTRSEGIELLDRAAEIGLLTPHGGGYSTIHPAVPWFFKGLFDKYYAAGSPPKECVEGDGPTRAFVEVLGALGDHYHKRYSEGVREVVAALAAEESNLLHARRLALSHGWWHFVISIMQGVRTLYDHEGHRLEWERLVRQIVPMFVDPSNDGPLSGREDEWQLVSEYRVRLARGARRWAEAERLQRIRVEWDRRRAAPALDGQPDQLDCTQRTVLRMLVVSLHELAQLQREQQQPTCVATYEESLRLAERIDDQTSAATCAFNIGNAFVDLPELRDPDEAERWHRRSLELRDQRDHLGRARCYSQLGLVAYGRFEDACAAGTAKEDLLRHLNQALDCYRRALGSIPPNAINDQSVVHNQLGEIYRIAGDLEQALHHFRESIRCEEVQENRYGAALTRFNVAVALADANRPEEAWEYAQSALRDFESYGDGATKDIEDTRELIAQIEREQRSEAGLT